MNIFESLDQILVNKKNKLEKLKGNDKNKFIEQSYVASLLNSGLSKINRKIIEEAFEVTEATRGKKTDLIYELTDLFFHLQVLMVDRKINWENIEKELSKRFGISGIVEKKNRNMK